jgi:hypothetical protein
MSRARRRSHLSIWYVWLTIYFRACAANAACECGYSVNRTSDATHAVYTDLMENDFLHTAGDNFTKFGWYVNSRSSKRCVIIARRGETLSMHSVRRHLAKLC